MTYVIDSTYLPFTADELRPHFVGDVDGHLAYYTKSAQRYHEFLSAHPETSGIPLSKARLPRQIEKDERFWTVTATKRIFDEHEAKQLLQRLLAGTYGATPPIADFEDWETCLDGDLRLYFEVCLPSPPSYVQWLRSRLNSRQIIPYIVDAAARDSARTLEGATHVDAMFLNVTNGFAWLIEAKVLSDISYSISFDNLRNQIARNIDVMLDNTSQPVSGLDFRKPESSLFTLLTPAQFKSAYKSRLYGWLMHEYTSDPRSLARDLPHREGVDWTGLAKRISWLTFEDLENVRPGACPWLQSHANTPAWCST
jgi:hypothetical protein